MELMKVILHSNAIERFEKIYPELVKNGQIDPITKQDYLKFLDDIQDLKIIHLVYKNCTQFRKHYFAFYYPCDTPYYPHYISKYIQYSNFMVPVPEELIKEFVYDPRIGLGYCTQCHTEYLIKTGCTQTTCIHGRCHPENFIPYLDKEGKKVFKGASHYKQWDEWKPDEYIPYSPERIEKNRQRMKDQRMREQIEEENSLRKRMGHYSPYEEAWITFSANQNWEKFEEVLGQLLADNKITQAKYEHGLNKAKKFKKILCAFGEL